MDIPHGVLLARAAERNFARALICLFWLESSLSLASEPVRTLNKEKKEKADLLRHFKNNLKRIEESISPIILK